jgi:hypothetical protein
MKNKLGLAWVPSPAPLKKQLKQEGKKDKSPVLKISHLIFFNTRSKLNRKPFFQRAMIKSRS